jgi:hypothetical protein
VASFVPTDVDTKIRSHLWFQDRPTAEHDRMRDFALGLARWDITGISARVVDVDGAGPVSGHDGERLSVLGGAYLGCLKIEDQSGADAVLAAIEAELAREAQAFDTLVRSYGRERDLLIVAAAMTHNAGDLDQGFSAEKGKRFGADAKAAFGRLAHDEPKRFGGAFAKAAALYKDILASEGHRHYPLREIRPLRAHPRLLLPVGPYFDQWGETLATWPEWDLSTRAHVIDGVVQGLRPGGGTEGLLPSPGRLRSVVRRRARIAAPRAQLRLGHPPGPQGSRTPPEDRGAAGVLRVESRKAGAQSPREPTLTA